MLITSALLINTIMDEPVIELARKLTEQLEAFLKACQKEGDSSIEDVLKRLEDLRKEE